MLDLLPALSISAAGFELVKYGEKDPLQVTIASADRRFHLAGLRWYQ
jgi:hypothetical protein